MDRGWCGWDRIVAAVVLLLVVGKEGEVEAVTRWM